MSEYSNVLKLNGFKPITDNYTYFGGSTNTNIDQILANIMGGINIRIKQKNKTNFKELVESINVLLDDIDKDYEEHE